MPRCTYFRVLLVSLAVCWVISFAITPPPTTPNNATGVVANITKGGRRFKTVFFIRHGQSFHNVEHCDRHPDSLLTPHGHQQAAGIAKLLPSSIQIVLFSPLRRVIQTTIEAFGSRCLSMDCLPVADLQEDNNGEIPCDTGSLPSKLAQQFSAFNFSHLADDWMNVGAHVARPLKLSTRRNRFKLWLEDLPQETIAVVAHAGTIRHILNDHPLSLLDNAGIVEVRFGRLPHKTEPEFLRFRKITEATIDTSSQGHPRLLLPVPSQTPDSKEEEELGYAHYVPHQPPEKRCKRYSFKENCGPLQPQSLPTLSPCGVFRPKSHNFSFGMVGDFGLPDAKCTQHVTKLVDHLGSTYGPLEMLLSTGDNNYWNGECPYLDQNIANSFPNFTRVHRPQSSCRDPRHGPVGEPPGVSQEDLKQARFFTTVGNHEFDDYASFHRSLPLLQYLSYLLHLPPGLDIAEGQFYQASFAGGAIEVFVLNSCMKQHEDKVPYLGKLHERQMKWVKDALKSSHALFRIVMFHHPIITTAQHGSSAPWMDAPWASWGASMILAGHQHAYERVHVGGVPHILNGLGGHPWLYEINDCDPVPGSQKRFNERQGAMVGLLSSDQAVLDVCFYDTKGSLVDHFVLPRREKSSHFIDI